MKAAARARNSADWTFTSLAALYPTKSQSICLQCRLRAVAPLRSRPSVTYLPHSNRRYASESIVSRISSKLWKPAVEDAPKATLEASDEEADPLRKAVREAEQREAERREAERLEMGIEDTDEPEEEPWTSLPVDPPADYKPALNAYGLPHSSDFQDHLKDPEKRYRRFMRETKLPSSELAGAVRQALIDISTQVETGLALTDPANLEDGRGSVSIERAKIFQNREGKILVQWAIGDMPGHATERKLTSLTPDEQADMGEEETRDVESATLEPATITDLEKPAEVQPQNSFTPLNEEVKNEPQVHELTSKDLIPFMRIRLEGDTLFAVLKRVMQLTGIRIPDCALQNIGTVKQLLAALQEKPKPTKLAQVLAVNNQLKKLPNVQLMATRYTPIDKEKENGRWKVIVKELKERDLPVTGMLPPSEIEDMLHSEVSSPKRERLLRQLNG